MGGRGPLEDTEPQMRLLSPLLTDAETDPDAATLGNTHIKDQRPECMYDQEVSDSKF